MIDYGTYYQERCANASMDQGIDELVKELSLLGISSTSEQTGGFTMCAYVELKDDRYIYANPYGAGLYNGEDGFIKDIYLIDVKDVKDVARAITQWIKENN
jgi:hypothetical protein